MAAVITLKTNFDQVTANIKEKLARLGDKEKLLRPIAIELIIPIFERIHKNGNDAADTPIGTYKNSYLKIREEKYGRMEGKKVVLSLTRLLEKDYNVIATERGYGIGFLNDLNFKKVGWLEEKYGKKIFSLSESENEYAITRFQELVNEALNS